MGKKLYSTARRTLKSALLKFGLLRESQFSRFENAINRDTWRSHDELLEWAERLAEREVSGTLEQHLIDSDDETALKGLSLRKKCLGEFKNKRKQKCSLRILVHTPSVKHSPGGASVFRNLVDSLNYIGVDAFILPWENHNIGEILECLKPNVLITSDHESYLRRIDWSAVSRYRDYNELRIGLTASIQAYGNSPLDQRLDWSKKHGVDFFYSFRAPEYLHGRSEYLLFFERGYKIHSVEFGANVLEYYPVATIERDLDYVFLASSNPDKWPRYFKYLTNILSTYSGFLSGPGWSKINRFAGRHTNRYLYSRAKVGINLHIQDSIDWPCELNERTYILAACGVPQVIDHPKLLSERFRLDGMFVADNAKQYEELFAYVLNHPTEAQERAFMAMEDAYSRHTTFHRAEEFVKALEGGVE